MDWPTSDQIQYWSGIITIVGLPVAVFAFLASWRQLSLSKRAGSVTALVALHDSFRDCWTDYLSAEVGTKPLAFGDLCNTIEIACAALTDRMFFGESRNILEAYLLNALKLIEGDNTACSEFLSLLQDPKTFVNIRRFLSRRRKQFRLLMVNATA
jgi:hypothetical protein